MYGTAKSGRIFRDVSLKHAFGNAPRIASFFRITLTDRYTGRASKCPHHRRRYFVVPPLKLFRIFCEDGAAVPCLSISEELLRLAGWTAETAVFCHIADTHCHTLPHLHRIALLLKFLRAISKFTPHKPLCHKASHPAEHLR